MVVSRSRRGESRGGAAPGLRGGGSGDGAGGAGGGGYVCLNPRKFNPNAFWLLRFMNDESVRFIYLRGGSSSSKSFSAAQTILCQTLFDEGNTLVMRKVGASILKTVYEDYRVACRGLGLSGSFIFKMNSIECRVNGARIDFSGLDDPEKIKGIANYKRLHLEELTEFDLADFKQLRKRLRGRAGQQIIATFNPISERHWIKREVMDAETWHDIPMAVSLGGRRLPDELVRVKSVRMNGSKQVLNVRTGKPEEHAPDAVVVQSTYLNNFWVVGSPDGTYGYYDSQCVADFEHDRLHDPAYYTVYALGEWGVVRTGSEFFGSFRAGRDTGAFGFDASLPVHLSVDNNVLPYISVGLWQVAYAEGGGKRLRQFAEVCAGQPDNSVRRAAGLVCRFLRGLPYGGKVYVHGDASTRMRNTIDEERRSWLDLFIDSLEKGGFEVVDKVGVRNPPVALTGEFVNAVWDGEVPGVGIEVAEACVRSIEDYQAVQKDENGGMLKVKVKDKATGQVYEEHGHLSDTLRYIVYDVCYGEFTAFSNRRKGNLYDSGLLWFNPLVGCVYDYTLLYVMPDVGGVAVMLEARRCGECWDVTRAALSGTDGLEEAGAFVRGCGFDLCVVECAAAYYGFVRDLREACGVADSIRALPESGQLDKRIAATADFVKGHVRFLPDGDAGYSAFVECLLDYNRTSGVREAAAALSGAAVYMAKGGGT